ncbi:MAG: 23S rRNA (adenine(2503)-C(2))-methyltransferase RlmN [Pontiellaceae bacterium]|jgi:23S rRNA (adenine2503-C2)-methyltransferase|nr:23S rRNA (adenine(2503)-C(2))-methyltransferase RlmN [Pontiellaceae bacterium]
MMLKPSIQGLLFEELAAFCKTEGQPAFRAKQIWDWLYVKRVSSFDEMKNLPAPFRAQLAEAFTFQGLEKLETKGDSGETQKLLFKLGDNELIETVIIPSRTRKAFSDNNIHTCACVKSVPDEPRNTVCLSCQVGCRFGCAFCASGQKGLIRNLTAGEIVGEVMETAKLLGGRPDNVVFMGIGEPFDNYDEVMKAVRILNHPDGLCIGARRITISTCGVVSGIQRLAEEGLQVELSVSLHAPDEETRFKLMPVNASWPLDDLLEACRAYTEKTNRIITFEYTLIKDINDSETQARELVRLLRRFPCRVNLIPLSPVEEFDGERPDTETMKRFFQILENAGINTTLRDSKGSALKAACGQLRARRL